MGEGRVGAADSPPALPRGVADKIHHEDTKGTKVPYQAAKRGMGAFEVKAALRAAIHL
jgi:hypothetical protein